jgi:hypothetical protein
MRVNANDRASIERVYSRVDFETEAQANARGDAAVLSGVRIDSMAAEDGGFELLRAARQVGEDDSAANSHFLCPYAQGAPGDGYDIFIDKIIATARAAHFDRSPGPGDPRLRGPRQ